MCYSKDGKYLITAGSDGKDSSMLNMKVWDAKTNKYIKVFIIQIKSPISK
jgi:WD40 repeat protein